MQNDLWVCNASQLTIIDANIITHMDGDMTHPLRCYWCLLRDTSAPFHVVQAPSTSFLSRYLLQSHYTTKQPMTKWTVPPVSFKLLIMFNYLLIHETRFEGERRYPPPQHLPSNQSRSQRTKRNLVASKAISDISRIKSQVETISSTKIR